MMVLLSVVDSVVVDRYGVGLSSVVVVVSLSSDVVSGTVLPGVDISSVVVAALALVAVVFWEFIVVEELIVGVTVVSSVDVPKGSSTQNAVTTEEETIETTTQLKTRK